MRKLLLLLLAGCVSEAARSFEPCRGEGVSARIEKVKWRRLTREVYRIGRMVGMKPPSQDVTVRICNGGGQPIHLRVPEVVNPDWTGSRCSSPGDWELFEHTAAFITIAGPVDPLASPRVAVSWTGCPFYFDDTSCHSSLAEWRGDFLAP